MQSTLARAGKIDVRRDEDQNIKLSQIIKLLINAGYFRARIKGLSPFDKIVGGMTWCIEVCNFDVDVDLLFHDSLTIGQKISLTERIVNVLPYMKCPYRIEPHQIQGLDSINIFPVMQWLVNLAIKTRTEYQDDTRIIAIDEFKRNYSYCVKPISKEEKGKSIKIIREIKLKYGPKRKFKRVDNAKPEGARENIMTTLLEYSASTQFPEINIETDEESEEEDKDWQVQLGEKMRLDEAPYEFFNADSSNLKTIKTRKELTLGKASSFTERISAIENDIADINREFEAKKESLHKTTAKEQEIQAELIQNKNKLLKLKAETKIYKDEIANVDQKKLEEMAVLIEENELAKKRTSDFKEKCRQEAELMKEKISNLTQELYSPDKSVEQSLLDLHVCEVEKLSQFRSQLGRKTREIEILKRLIDDVPGREEIAQYQRRFIELYNLVRAEQHETLQFYSMHNTLADSRSYMEKESVLLNSILDNMEQGLSTSSSLEEYLQQLESIIDGIKQNKIKLEKKKSEARIQRSSLSAELNRLQELQLLYARMLHQFSQEITKNEALCARLESSPS